MVMQKFIQSMHINALGQDRSETLTNYIKKRAKSKLPSSKTYRVTQKICEYL